MRNLNLSLIPAILLLTACTAGIDPLVKKISGDDKARQEMEALLDQKYIDPIADYIDEHQGDPEREQALIQLQAERETRCQAVARIYAEREKSYHYLNRLKRNYTRACPDVVTDFAAQVAAAEPADSPEAQCRTAFEEQETPRVLAICRPLAEQGDPDAQLLVARVYAGETGQQANPREAYVWASLSAFSHNTRAQTLQAELAEQLTEEQRFEAEERMLRISERYP